MVSMSSYAFQLLISYLQEQKYILFLKIINQYVKLRSTCNTSLILVTVPSDSAHNIGFEMESKVEICNQVSMDWGVHHVDPRIEVEIYRRLRSEIQKQSNSHKVSFLF